MYDWVRSTSPLTTCSDCSGDDSSHDQSSSTQATSSSFPSPIHSRRHKISRAKSACKTSPYPDTTKRQSAFHDQYIEIQSAVWEPIAGYDRTKSPHASNGYKGTSRDMKRFPITTGSAAERLRHLQASGYRLSRYIPGRNRIYIDRNGAIFAIACIPDGDRERVARLTDRLTKMDEFAKKDAIGQEKRGSFSTLSYGISMGPGSKRPHPRLGSDTSMDALDDFFHSDDLQLHLENGINCWKTILPEVYDYYQENLDAIMDRYPDCYQAIPCLPFAGYTLNCSPQCICKNHVDFNNLATGLCLINPLGFYDYSKGGHIVLHDAKLIIEVPAGSQVYIPSATMPHETIPVAEHETRNAFTGYSAGAIFQFVENDFQLVSQRMQNKFPGKKVWKDGLARYPKVHKLCRDHY